jgi:hypothetical protein
MPTESGAGAKPIVVTTPGGSATSTITYFLPHAEETKEFSAGGSYTIPDWADAIDIICLGGGGGGQAGGAANANGTAGLPGMFGTDTIDVTALRGTALRVTVGAGGNGGPGPLKGVGAPGTDSTVAGTGVPAVTGKGGVPGATGLVSGIRQPKSAHTNHYNGKTYTVPATGTVFDPWATVGSVQKAMGAGGWGGGGGLFGGGPGGKGGAGHVWIRAYQIVNTVRPGNPDFVPVLKQFTAAGAATFTIPADCWVMDIVCLGSGKGGQSGMAMMVSGAGGDPGEFNSVTITRGTEIPKTTTTLSINVGAGGKAGLGTLGTPGGNGNPTTVSGAGWAGIRAAGATTDLGVGSAFTQAVGKINQGGRTYVGGAANNVFGAAGKAPGGGGVGGAGDVLGGHDGGAGAPGSVWIYCY